MDCVRAKRHLASVHLTVLWRNGSSTCDNELKKFAGEWGCGVRGTSIWSQGANRSTFPPNCRAVGEGRGYSVLGSMFVACC